MKKMTLILAGILAAALMLGACAVVPATPAATATPEATATQDAAMTDDSAALEFSLNTLTGGTLDQSVFTNNKLVMVNYWATWCGPCVSEIPDLVKISKEYADKGFAIVGVLTSDNDIEGAKQFIDDQGITYPIIVPEDMFLDYTDGMYAIPTTLFFDSEGNQIGEAIVGSKSYEDWTGLIDLLLGQVS